MTLQDPIAGVIAPVQSTVLARIEERFRSKHVGLRLAHDLIAQSAAAIGADLAVFTKTTDGWTLLANAGDAPDANAAAFAELFAQLTPGTPTPREVAGSTWTFFLASEPKAKAVVAAAGIWASSSPLAMLAAAICVNAARSRPRPTLESAARIGQILYRMTREIARASTMDAVAEVVVRHAAAAVHARIGALAVRDSDGDDTAIAATFGYSRRLVEHVRIEAGTGVIGTVMSSRRPVKVDRAGRTTGRRLRYRTDSFVVVPILANAEAVGALCVTDRAGDEEFTADDVSILRRFAATAALAIERQRAIASAEKFAHAAAMDPITGVFNRRHLHIRLDEELQRSRRHNIPVAVLVLDIDDFKTINDSYGHLVGDLVLRDVAEILRRSVRVFDICARFGGDEFVIVMPGSAPAGAARIAERIRERIATYTPADRRLARLGLTASIGLAMSFAESTAADILERADRALYTAKHQGKNRVSTLDQRGS